MKWISRLLVVVMLCAVPRVAASQGLQYEHLSETFSSIFNRILTEGFQLSPGQHANHFVPAADRTSQELVPALNSLISSNVASFPMSSTVAGITFDFSTGAPIRVVESLGPIFAETASTLGDRKLTVGFNATYLGLDNIRSIPLDQMQFAFLHEDVGDPGLGTDASELDVVRVWLGLNASASIFAFYATYGVAPNLDVGIAVPFLNVTLEGTTRAVIDSYTLAAIGRALHFFGGEPLDPTLVQDFDYSQTATGIGDLGIRFKYRFPGTMSNFAALVDVRLPTGDELEFLGTGSTTARLMLIGSQRMGGFTPHFNVGYDYRGAVLDSDEFEFAIGFDQQITPGVTFALDLLGEIDLVKDDAIHLLPGSETITFTNENTGAVSVRNIALSNVPYRNHDSMLRTAIGARFAPTERLQFLANVLIPLTNSGLYSNVTPTIGFSVLL